VDIRQTPILITKVKIIEGLKRKCPGVSFPK